jgi:tetratricopeptide (TPR) repeat protein
VTRSAKKKRGHVKDGQGLEVANADAKAIEALDFLREEWLVFGKRFDGFIAAADAEEKCALLPALAANLFLSMNSAEGHALGAKYLARAQAMSKGIGARERAWLAATLAWVDGDTDRSLAIHEKMVAEWPRDLLAGKLGQLHASNLGDAEALLRIGERLIAVNPDNAHVRGMHAFALAECNRLDEAEAEARRALASPWAQRALMQCFDGRGRLAEGVSFLTSTGDAWPEGKWHLALFLIDLDRLDEALALYGELADEVSAISLLARLELRDVDVGDRWQNVASYLEGRLHDHFVPFLDLQYLYALARAGKTSAVTEMLASLEDRAEQAKPFEREAWADCAVPGAHGLAAQARGDHAEAARLLGQAMPHLRPIGGSIAQRALFGAIHLDALIKSGWNDAALKILQADERERPTVPSTKRALADLYRKLGRSEQAMTADYQAEQLARQYRTAA